MAWNSYTNIYIKTQNDYEEFKSVYERIMKKPLDERTHSDCRLIREYNIWKFSLNPNLVGFLEKRNQRTSAEGFIFDLETYGQGRVEECFCRTEEISGQIGSWTLQLKSLVGRKFKHKRNKLNRQIKELKDKRLEVFEALIKSCMKVDKNSQKFKNKEFGHSKKHLKWYTPTRFCSHCKKRMTEWSGCPCKTAWYCDETCQRGNWSDH
jgi:hypothetical protein